MFIDKIKLHIPVKKNDSAFQRVTSKEWMFDFDDPYSQLFNHFCQLQEMDLSDEKLEKEYIKIIKKMPEVFDASSQLADIYLRQNKIEQARQLYEHALKIARGHISKEFIIGKHLIPWHYMENRPFLRLLEGYAFFVGTFVSQEKALLLYEEILLFNPNDNQGLRTIVTTLYFKLKQPEKVVDLARKYKDDFMPEVTIGNILALYQLNKKVMAKKSIMKYFEDHQNTLQEIVKSNHRKPATVRDDGLVTMNGTDRAWHYWQQQGKFWKNSFGAQEFLKDCLASFFEKD